MFVCGPLPFFNSGDRRLVGLVGLCVCVCPFWISCILLVLSRKQCKKKLMSAQHHNRFHACVYTHSGEEEEFGSRSNWDLI